MTDRFTAWVEQNAMRDWSAANLALLAIMAVCMFGLIYLWPPAAARWGRRIYTVVGILIYVALLVFSLVQLVDLAS